MDHSILSVQSYTASKEFYRPTPDTVLQVHSGTVIFNPNTAIATCSEHGRSLIYNETSGFFSCPKCATTVAIKLLSQLE